MLTKIFPFLAWFKHYSPREFKLDLIAGLTVALVLIPQSMAYAQLAGLPAYYGLYASFLPPMIAALFGSSRQLATGPVAVVSLMTAASLEPLATAGSQEFIAYAILLALVVGIFQFLLGVLRLGLIVELLSHPVINGFTVAAAIIIATSQLSKMFGVYVDSAPHKYQEIFNVLVSAFKYTHLPTLLIGLLAIAIQVLIRMFDRRIPNVLIAVALTTILSWGMGFEHNTTVSIDMIQSPEIVSEIKAFNVATKNIETLSQLRTKIGKKIESLDSLERDSITRLNFQHELEQANFQIKSNTHSAREYRSKLRQRILVGVAREDGSSRFYLPDQLPKNETPDGFDWRVKVSNNTLNESSLTLTGGGAVVGNIPKGLPSLAIPVLNVKIFFKLLPYAIVISLLGFMEAIAIAKAMAAKTGQKIDTNLELRGQGLANIIGALGQSYPVSGSFSRSSVNLQNGGVSGLSNVISSLMVVIVLLFFTPLLYHLPQSVLASVIMLAVFGLIKIEPFIHTWKVNKLDGAISIITFISTLYFAPNLEEGILIGVVLTMMVFLFKSMRPKVVNLSLSKELTLREAKRFGLKECDYICVLRFDGRLFFANASYLDEKISRIKAEKPNLKHILIIGEGINDIDASGEEMLSSLVDKARQENCGLSLCGVKEQVITVLQRSHLLDKIGEENIHQRAVDAIEHIFKQTHENNDEERAHCPLMTYTPLEPEN